MWSRSIPNRQAQQGAFSRGKMAKIRGAKKADNPYRAEQSYRADWLDGFASIRMEKKREEYS